jgi:hypothetical protein
MKRTAFLLITIAALGACSTTQRDTSAREWARAECNRVIDNADRERCMKRVEEIYGNGPAERREPPKR